MKYFLLPVSRLTGSRSPFDPPPPDSSHKTSKAVGRRRSKHVSPEQPFQIHLSRQFCKTQFCKTQMHFNDNRHSFQRQCIALNLPKLRRMSRYPKWCENTKECANFAQKAQTCSRVLKVWSSVPKSKKCSKSSQCNRDRPTRKWQIWCHLFVFLSFVIGAFQGQYLGVGNYIRIQNGLLRWHPGLRLLDSYGTYSRFLLFLETCHAELPPNFFHPTEAKCPWVSEHSLNAVTTNI